jgi:hypothetical protein
MEPRTRQVANFYRGEIDPEHLDEVLSILRDICEKNIREEPRTTIQAFHLEPPNVVWVYALFEDDDAREEHRRANALDPRFYRVTELQKTDGVHETIPLFAKGITIVGD